jgi:sn-1 stearoyl-lipid 9-desaturase
MVAVSHISRSRRFETRNSSTNNWWVALLSFGDGWHNNHHAYPVSARHGLKWYLIDFSRYAIWILTQLHRGEWSAGKHPAKSLAAFER